MAKAEKPTKKRAPKYEDKVSFDGTFEDMIGISVKQAEKKAAQKMKYAIGDAVMYSGTTGYKVIATKLERGNYDISGFDYIIQLKDDKDFKRVFEEDITT